MFLSPFSSINGLVNLLLCYSTEATQGNQRRTYKIWFTSVEINLPDALLQFMAFQDSIRRFDTLLVIGQAELSKQRTGSCPAHFPTYKA